ncbi:MAG: SDR family oxidoreductase [Pseudomonadota bacterium]|nr:SDR family oxidoreductase [Pseudomonadota bacterium]
MKEPGEEVRFGVQCGVERCIHAALGPGRVEDDEVGSGCAGEQVPMDGPDGRAGVDACNLVADASHGVRVVVGGGHPGTVAEIAEDDWDRVVQINLKTAMQGTKAAIPAMLRASGGSIINISSIVGWAGMIADTGSAAYATAKAALHGLTHSTAANYVTQNIRCNCIIVGTVETPMVAHLGEEALQRRVDMVPMQTKGTGWDIGHAAVYLLSDEARWVTAVNLPVDGGLIGLRTWPR